MPISYVNQTTFSGVFSGDIPLDVPAGGVKNDLLIATISYKSAEVLNTPAGWTRIGTVQGGSDAVDVFYKLHSGAEPANYTFTLTPNGTSRVEVGIMDLYHTVNYRNLYQGKSAVASGSASPVTFAAAAVARSNSLVYAVAQYTWDSSGSRVMNGPSSGYTARTDTFLASGFSTLGVYIEDKLALAGSETPGSFTATLVDWASQSFIFNPFVNNMSAV